MEILLIPASGAISAYEKKIIDWINSGGKHSN